MDFIAAPTEFPSLVHKTVCRAAKELVPADISLRDVPDGALRASCAAYLAFVTDMLADMYGDPAAYGLPVRELDDFLGGKKLNGVRRRYPDETNRLLARTRSSADRYMLLLAKLGFAGRAENGVLVIGESDISAIGKALNTSVSPTPIEKRLAALERVGLKRVEAGFVSERHADMFTAMCALAAPTKGKATGFDFFNFSRADFRNLSGGFKPSHEDYYAVLDTDKREIALKIHEFARGLGCRAAINTFYKVDYKYKGAQVMCVETTGGTLGIRLVETYGWDDPALIESRVARESDEVQRYAQRRLWRCNACSTEHLGAFTTFLGKPCRVCSRGLLGFRRSDPSDADMEYMRRFIGLRLEIINELKKKK